MRTFLAALALYIGALLMLDALTMNGYYRHAAWQVASYQAQRVGYEVRSLIGKIGI